MSRMAFFTGLGLAFIAATALFVFLNPDSERNDGFQDTAVFPPRRDELVIDTSRAAPPDGLYSAGQRDAFLATLGSRGAKVVLISNISPLHQEETGKALTELFGTPAAPRLPGFDDARLAEGSRVYKKRCIDCHGMVGDGRGPTSTWVYPPARDFRSGGFKYVSTANGLGWPTHDDIVGVIRRGLPGASMQSYAMLPESEIDAVADYTLYLAFRGRVEFELLKACADDPPENLKEQAAKELAKWQQQWRRSIESEIKPVVPDVNVRDGGSDAAYDVRVREGNKLFLSDAVGCVKCHEDYGRKSTWRYDAWGTPVKPPDLTKGEARGGKEPLDYFHRLRSGIVPSGMPAMSSLTDEQIWNLVQFLKALPDPRHLPADVRKAVYPEASP